MSYTNGRIYGETDLDKADAEAYRKVAIQRIKEYSKSGSLGEIQQIERINDEIEFSFNSYQIRTFSVMQTDGIRKHGLVSNADGEEIQQMLKRLGQDVREHVDILTE